MKITKLALFLSIDAFTACAGIPSAERNSRADQLMARAVSGSEFQLWQQTSAVEFVFNGGNRHFWDRKRNLAEVVLGGKIQVQMSFLPWKVACRKWDKQSKAAGELTACGDYARKAYEAHINDTYWLNPVYSFAGKDHNSIWYGSTEDGDLLVKFLSGGVTPGDTYLYRLRESDNRIDTMRLWVKKLPFKGVTATYSEYSGTGDGPLIARKRRMSGFTITIEDARTYKVYPAPGQTDRFAGLLAQPG